MRPRRLRREVSCASRPEAASCCLCCRAGRTAGGGRDMTNANLSKMSFCSMHVHQLAASGRSRPASLIRGFAAKSHAQVCVYLLRSHQLACNWVALTLHKTAWSCFPTTMRNLSERAFDYFFKTLSSTFPVLMPQM